MKPRILHLTLTKKWFDMIASGEKKEEYRDVTPYWNVRLNHRTYDYIRFRNGYSRGCPVMTVEWLGHSIEFGHSIWGAPTDRVVHVIRLGDVVINRGTVQYLASRVREARASLRTFVASMPDKAVTRRQAALQKKHSTPREMARAAVAAIGEISFDEAVSGSLRYLDEWNAAGAPGEKGRRGR